MKTCHGIEKTTKNPDSRRQECRKKISDMCSVFDDYMSGMSKLNTKSPFPSFLNKKILLFQNKYEAFKWHMSEPTADDIQCFEDILLKMRRIYLDQKRLNEKQQAAQHVEQKSEAVSSGN
jgi:hypothetical protein